jgi:hypothetical protein
VCLPPAITAASMRSRRLPGIPLMSNTVSGIPHNCNDHGRAPHPQRREPRTSPARAARAGWRRPAGTSISLAATRPTGSIAP